jgi:vacuolar-type H+-ATPase subunit I/STV1
LAQLIHEAFEKPVTMSPSFPEQETLSLYQHVDEFLKSYAHICEVKQQEAMEQNNLPLRYWEISSLEMNKKLAEFGQGALHPIETAEGIIEGLHKLGELMKPLVEFMGHVELGREHGNINLALANKKYEEFTHNISKIQQHLQSLSPEEKVKFATDLVFDFKIAPVLISKAGKLAGALKNVSKELVQSTNIKKLAQMPEKLRDLTQFSEVCEKRAQQLDEVATKIQLIQKYEQEAIQLAKKIENITNLEQSIEKLRKTFDQTRKGFAEFTNKYIKLDYGHILAPEIKATKNGLKLSGFHHDYLDALKNNNIVKVTNKVMKRAGFYTADIIFEGKLFKEKTFFPSNWSQEKVISTIMEAYDNFKSNGGTAMIEKGKYRIKGMSQEGITIEMYVTMSGKITTAYPIL